MKNNLQIVITMGGIGSRFRNKGYNIPKYMIEAKGKTLFEWSMISLDGYKDISNKYIFIALRDENVDVESFIKEQCKKLNLNMYHIIILDKLTDGQATTAMMAQEFWNEADPLLIYNIDTYVESGQMNSKELKGDGFIPCFKASGSHWSFVKLNDKGIAVEIKEKERISDNCTLGAYYFKSCLLYKNLYNEMYNKYTQTEKYVAPLYNLLVQKGGRVYISQVDSDKVHVLGTPDELEQFIYE